VDQIIIVIFAFENLMLQQPCQGIDNVTVGNGRGLQIANTSCTVLLFTPKTKLLLQNIIQCPDTSSNLLTIQKICKDLSHLVMHFVGASCFLAKSKSINK